MQKILFYQENKPSTAEGIWLHHGVDSDGKKKQGISIDYIQNGVVRPIYDVSLMADSSSVFDSTANYSAGDIIMYDGKLYVFESDHSAGEWDATEVSETDLLSLVTAGGGGSSSDAVLRITPTEEAASEYQTANAADAAQALGISEQDFLLLLSSKAPATVLVHDSYNSGYWSLMPLKQHYCSEPEITSGNYVIYGSNGMGKVHISVIEIDGGIGYSIQAYVD